MLHNLRYNETLFTLHNASGAGTNADLFLTGSEAQAARQSAGGACTNIAFRTGETEKQRWEPVPAGWTVAAQQEARIAALPPPTAHFLTRSTTMSAIDRLQARACR